MSWMSAGEAIRNAIFPAKAAAILAVRCWPVLFFLTLTMESAAGAAAKRVLIVHSFGTVAPPFTIHSTAFETELVRKTGGHVDLDEVSLDMARYADPHLQEALVEYLEKRQAQWRPDLVVPIGSPAGVFVAQYRQRLFPDIPIVYCGMDRRRLPGDAFARNATFVGENFDLPGFVEEILEIAPATKNIAVVMGASPVEKYWAKAFRQAFQPFTGRINFIWLDDLPFDQMLERVSKLPSHSFIFLVLLIRDASGVSHNADEALQRMHAVANAPINSIFLHQLGLGIVGGRLYQASAEGTESARIAARILRGEPASSFPPKIIGPVAPRYDWRELERWNIDEKRLPQGSTVLFRSPTFWQQYEKWIIAGSSIFLLQAVLIAGLVANLIRRRRAEGSLAESEERFQSMADAAPMLVWMSGRDQLFTFFNKAWFDFTGRTMKQELGDGWCEGIHPEDRERCLAVYLHAFEAREPLVMQYRLRRYDGEYRFVTNQGVPRYGADGGFLGYVGACVDVTDMIEKERALHEVEERVTLAAEVAHLGVWELDLVTNELWVSENGRNLFGFAPDGPLTYDDFRARVHPEDRARHATAVRRAIDDQSGYESEFRILLPDHTVRWIAGRGRYVNNPETKQSRFVGVSMDVTERKQAQQLFQLATEASPSGIVLLNADGRIILVNAHVEELFGYQRDELIGKPVEMLLPARFAAHQSGPRIKFLARLQAQVIDAGQELLARRKDGSEFPVETELSPIDAPQGFLVLASVIDLSARKEAEEEAQRRRDEIEQLSRVSLLGEMTASIAHEVNQPLSGIISNASAGQRFIDRGEVDPETLREILVDIAADGHRAHDVIRNIRNTIKKGGAIREPMDVNEVVAKITHLVEPDAAAHSCELQISLEENLPAINGDPVQIQQVLINLVGNAFDAMRDTPVERRKVIIATGRNGRGTVELSVRDYGAGIGDEALDQLFQQFFTTKEDGLGMGLAIVRSIVEAHSGTITAENAAGGGAEFRVTLPVSQEEAV
jgi:PAS domain S-box-containing protein